MDPLRQHDLEVARATSPEDKAVQALEAMQLGIDLERASLRTRHLALSDEAIDELLLTGWREMTTEESVTCGPPTRTTS